MGLVLRLWRRFILVSLGSESHTKLDLSQTNSISHPAEFQEKSRSRF